MLAMGVKATIIGHCEERNDKMGILAEAGVVDTKAVNRKKFREFAVTGTAFRELAGKTLTFSDLTRYPLVCLGEKMGRRTSIVTASWREGARSSS